VTVLPRTRIHSREDWGARGSDRFTQLANAGIDNLIHHYSSMDAERRTEHSGCDDVVRAIEAYHINRNGWRGIAYSWLYCHHGHIYEGRGWGAMTAATLGHNDHTQSVCFLGTDVENRDDLTQRGREAAAHLTNEFLDLYGRRRRIRGHREFVPTTCPGAEITAWIAAKGWLVDDPTTKPWPLPIPRAFRQWAKWRRERMNYRSEAAWRRAQPKSVRRWIAKEGGKVPDWAWVRLAAIAAKP
jgi:hypothetical protein